MTVEGYTLYDVKQIRKLENIYEIILYYVYRSEGNVVPPAPRFVSCWH